MVEQDEKISLDSFKEVVSRAKQASVRVAAGMRTVNDALRVLIVGVQDLAREHHSAHSQRAGIACGALNDMLSQALAVCAMVNDSARRTRCELDRTLSDAKLNAMTSPPLAHLQREAAALIGTLSAIEATADLARASMSHTEVQIQRHIRQRVAEQSSWQETQALLSSISSRP